VGIGEYRARVAAEPWDTFTGAIRDFPLAAQLAALDVEEVLGHICHQDVLEASAVPVASAWALLADGSAGPDPLYGLEYLASNTAHARQHVGLGLQYPGFAGTCPWPSERQLNSVLDWERWSDGVIDAVVSAAPVLTAAVRDRDHREVRLRAAGLLRYVPAAACDQDLLVALATQDGDPALRAGLAATIVSQERDAPPAQVLATAVDLLDADSAGTRSFAAVALLLALPHPAATAVESRLPGLLTEPEIRTDDHLPGRGTAAVPAGFVAEAMVASRLPDASVARALLDAYAVWCTRSGDEDLDLSPVHHLGERVFQRVFGRRLGCRDYLTRNDLNDLERDVLSTLTQLPPQPVGMFAAAAGLRDWRADTPRLLGLGTGGLDTEVSGEWFGRTVRWPVWKWWLQARDVDRYWPGHSKQAHELVRRILRRGLSADRARAAVADARSGGYDIPADDLEAALANPDRGPED
jgi:hypothetical protein